MTKQILLIHGAESFSKYEDFLEHLRKRPISDPLGLEVKKRWKNGLKEELSAKGYEVYFPSMPNRDNAKYEEWKIWFERYFEFLHDEVILIGHSQGGYFLAKYLSENKMPVTVAALYLLAAPFEPDDFAEYGNREDGGDFAFDPKNIGNIEAQVDTILIYHSEDDPVVPYAHASKYVKALPSATLVSFKNSGHFLMEEFPELQKSILELS